MANQLSRARYSKKHLGWAVALLLAWVAAWPLLAEPGLLNTRGGGDSPFLLQRLHQLETALVDGHFPVRWMPDANYGYGYPFYNFYAPLSIYITAVFRFIGFSYSRSIQLSQLLGFVTAAGGMFFLARRWFKNEWAGLLAAVAYTVAPFHLVNVYVRGDSLAEFWAMAFFPLVILAADNIISDIKASPSGMRKRVALFALAYAALILSHNISALIFSPFLLLYLLLRTTVTAKRANDQSPISNLQSLIPPLLAALLLALGLSAWFFVPALSERSLAQLDAVTQGYFHYRNHFLGTAEHALIQPTFFFNYSVTGRQAFRMGLIQTLTTGFGLITLLTTWLQKRLHPLTATSWSPSPRPPGRPHRDLLVALIPFILLTLLISTFMLTPLSRSMWQQVPLLPFTQFPWRFLSIQAFGGALATAVLAQLPWRKFIVPVISGLLFVAAMGKLPADHLSLTDADVTAEKLAQYEWFTGNIGTTVSFEYLPAGVQPRPYTSTWLNRGERWSLQALSGERLTYELSQQKTARQVWHVDTAAPDTLIFPTLHWPGWQATVDGEAVPVRPSPGTGLITLDLPAGEHTVILTLARTPVRRLAELVSLTAVLVTLWLLKPAWWVFFGHRRRRSSAALLAGLILLIIVVRLWPQPALEEDDLTWDFQQMGYLHHDTDGISFDNGLRLVSYEYDRDLLTAGDTFTITTQWEAAASAQPAATISLNSPALNWTNPAERPSPPAISRQTQIIDGRQVTFELAVPPNAPAGLFVPHLQLADGRPLMPSGEKRGDLFLRPIRIANAQSAPAASLRLDARAHHATLRTANILDVQLAWMTAQPLTHDYNISLRLTDADGRFLRLVDVQPGYGFQPSSQWPVGEWVNDWLAIPLPTEAHQFPYALVAQVYDVTNQQTAVLTRRLGELVPDGEQFLFRETERVFMVPDGIEPATAVFADTIQLHGYTMTQSDDTLHLTLYWGALAAAQNDYVRFVHLINPTAANQPPVVQDDSMPRYGSYPTSQWTAGEVIDDSLMLSLAGVPAGEYNLAVGFYEVTADDQVMRLTAVDAQGTPLPDARLILPVTVEVKE